MNSESGAIRLIVTVSPSSFADHAALQRARGRLLEARLRADDARVEDPGGRALHLVDALERCDDVVHRERLPVRELDPLPQLEDPGLAAVRRRGQVLGEVGNDRERIAAAGLLEGEKTVVGRLEQLPVLERVVDLRIERAARRLGVQLQRAATVRCGVPALPGTGDHQRKQAANHHECPDPLHSPSSALALRRPAIVRGRRPTNKHTSLRSRGRQRMVEAARLRARLPRGPGRPGRAAVSGSGAAEPWAASCG